MAQFERLIAPSEQEVAGRLKSYIADVQDNPQQVGKHTTSAQVVMCFVCICVYLPYVLARVFASVLAVAGLSKAQGVDQTPHHQQRAAVRERDPTGQTAGL